MVLDSLSKTQKLGMVGILATIALVAVIGRRRESFTFYLKSTKIFTPPPPLPKMDENICSVQKIKENIFPLPNIHEIFYLVPKIHENLGKFLN
jgi:hypothetical protein